MNTPHPGEVTSMQSVLLQQECEKWKARCHELELAVELLKCKNAKLELDVQSLRAVNLFVVVKVLSCFLISLPAGA